MTEHDRFLSAKKAISNTHSRYNIGTYKERSQHLFLKHYYEPDVCFHEVPLAGYITDIHNEEGITEIQTAGFRALHDKLTVFLQLYPVTVVYPVQRKARTIWIDNETGESTQGRYSSYPKALYRIYSELLPIAELLSDKKLSIHIVELSVSKYRLLDGYGSDRKKRATKIDTIPEDIISVYRICGISELRELFPFEKGERITQSDISKKMGLRRMPLWRAIKLLTLLEVLEKDGKKGNSIIYKVN